jgi:hypothetical protein
MNRAEWIFLDASCQESRQFCINNIPATYSAMGQQLSFHEQVSKPSAALIRRQTIPDASGFGTLLTALFP